MGLWAEANIPKMTMAELNQMAFVLDEVGMAGSSWY